MTTRVRMKRLEAAVRRQTPAQRPARLTEEDWLEQHEAWGRAGVFAAEPDYSVALAAYREALEKAYADAGPGEERSISNARLTCCVAPGRCWRRRRGGRCVSRIR
jgi:hypothetical protein